MIFSDLPELIALPQFPSLVKNTVSQLFLIAASVRCLFPVTLVPAHCELVRVP